MSHIITVFFKTATYEAGYSILTQTPSHINVISLASRASTSQCLSGRVSGYVPGVTSRSAVELSNITVLLLVAFTGQ